MAERSELINKVASRLVAGIYLSHLDPNQHVLEYQLKQLATGTKQKRLASLVSLTSIVFPNLPANLARKVTKPDRLPFNLSNIKNAREIELVAKGEEQFVFRVDRERGLPSLALKINRASLGYSTSDLLVKAKEVRAQYQRISDWYTEVPNFIPKEEFVVLNGPLLGKPAMGVIQPFIDTPMTDFIEDYQQDQRIELVEGNPFLRDQFLMFAPRMLEILKNEGVVPDILGKGNLVVMGNEEPDKMLMFIDPHIIHPLNILRRDPNGQVISMRERVQAISDTYSRVKPFTISFTQPKSILSEII